MTDPEKPQYWESEVHREVLPHTTLHNCADNAYWRGLEAPARDAAKDDFMVANLMAALSFEAYLNFAGEKLYPDEWEYLERITAENKLAAICARVNIEIDYGSDPFRTIKELRGFRNALAHAAPDSVAATQRGPIDKAPTYPEAKWERQCTKTVAKRFIDQVRDLTDQIHSAGDLGYGRIGHLGARGQTLVRPLTPKKGAK